MSSKYEFTKKILDQCFKELGKEFRKRNGKKIPAEIILIGGASVLINYDFREMTDDADAIIEATSVMKESIYKVADILQLPNNWLNTDFTKSSSFSRKLIEVSEYYKQFSNILNIRTVKGKYLIAMKLMSGRTYKYDLSDIAGILLEHKINNNPISKDEILQAVNYLYDTPIPDKSQKFLDELFERDLHNVYDEIRSNEQKNKNLLTTFQDDYPGIINRSNIDEIIEIAKSKLVKTESLK